MTALAAKFKDHSSHTPEDVATLALAFGKTVELLSEEVTSAAAAVPDAERTQILLNGCKAVAISAKQVRSFFFTFFLIFQVVLSLKDALNNPDDKTGQATLEAALASFPKATTTLQRIATNADQNSGSGVSKEIDSIGKDIEEAAANLLRAPARADIPASTQSVIQAARAVSRAAGPIVISVQPESLVDSAVHALRAVEDLLIHVKSAATASPVVSSELSEYAKTVASRMKGLLEVAKVHNYPHLINFFVFQFPSNSCLAQPLRPWNCRQNRRCLQCP